ncbi:hypothetical protein LP7551_04464 [Roseibium album]|nr:hypothetical protein LP7551_04464 [Roseibium album]
MTNFYAQPYDISADGFYFESFEDYSEKAAKAVNHYGEPVEEFEIQFIDGEDIDCELAKAFGVNKANLRQFFDAVGELEGFEKTMLILAVGECGYQLDSFLSDPDSIDVEIHHLPCMRELAEQFVAGGLFGGHCQLILSGLHGFPFFSDFRRSSRRCSPAKVRMHPPLRAGMRLPSVCIGAAGRSC